MSLTSSRDDFEKQLFDLWSRNPPPETASLDEIKPIIESLWNSAEVTGYSGLTVSCDYSKFYSYISDIMSWVVTADTMEEGAENIEQLLRHVPENTVFDSDDSGISFVSISPVQDGEAFLGSLSRILVPLFVAGNEGDPKLEEIISSFADFFLGWEVEVDDSGTIVTAAII